MRQEHLKNGRLHILYIYFCVNYYDFYIYSSYYYCMVSHSCLLFDFAGHSCLSLHSDLSTLYVVRHHFNLFFYKIILIGRTDFIYFVHMFLGILPSSAAREGRLDYHGGSSREACKVLVILIFSLFLFNLLMEPFLNMYC